MAQRFKVHIRYPDTSIRSIFANVLLPIVDVRRFS